MRVLVYDSLPDIERAAFSGRLRAVLRNSGHEVYCLADEQTDFRLDHGQGEHGRINCIGPLCRHLVLGNRDSVYVHIPTKPPFSPEASCHRTGYYEQVLREVAPDCILVWNGLATHHRDFIRVAEQLSLAERLHYLECGWLPQKNSIYCDPDGINGNSSIASQRLPELSGTQREELAAALARFRGDRIVDKQPGTILVPLQMENDTSILHFSPFPTMQTFVAFLEKWIPPGYRVVIRPHPRSNADKPLRITREDFTVDGGSDVHDALARTETVVGINSTTLIEAMAFDCTVLAFGRGVFSCLDSVCVDAQTDFKDAVAREQDCAPLLHDLLFGRQIPSATLEGIGGFIREPEGMSREKVVGCAPYPLVRLLVGCLRYWVGRGVKHLGF